MDPVRYPFTPSTVSCSQLTYILSTSPTIQIHSYQQSTLESQVQHPIQAHMDEYKRFATLHGYQENQQPEHFEVVSKAVGGKWIDLITKYYDLISTT
jgi:hypothetical protein